MIRNTLHNIQAKRRKGDTGVNAVAPKMGMMNFWADGGIPVRGVTEWVISSNKGTTEEGLFIIFSLYVCVSCVFDG